MSRARLALIALLLSAAAAALGFAAHQALRAVPGAAEVAAPPAAAPPSGRRPEFRLADLAGRERSVSEWDGSILVINFWATWCAPCRQEIPHFVALQKRYGEAGVQFLGVAIDEVDPVRDFVAEFGINYPILVGENDAIDAARAYGNAFAALPYTVIVARDGRLVFSHRGVLSEAQAEEQVKARL